MYFQLLIGGHFDAIKKIKYSAGDIIPSEKDLAKSHGSDKFRKLTKKEVAAMELPDEKPVAVTVLKRKKVKKFKRNNS